MTMLSFCTSLSSNSLRILLMLTAAGCGPLDQAPQELRPDPVGVGKADGAADAQDAAYRWTTTSAIPSWAGSGTRTQIVYDAAQDVPVAVGPSQNSTQPGFVVAAYDRDAHGWNPVPGGDVGGPQNRTGFAAVYNAPQDRILVYGGSNDWGELDDLWAFEDGVWTALSAEAGPGPRAGAVMVDDPAHDRVLLFGGHGWYGHHNNDLWAFDGTQWERLSDGTGGPTPRAYGSMAYDPVRDRVVVAGGRDSSGTWASGTSEWGDGAWHTKDDIYLLGWGGGGLYFDPALAEVVSVRNRSMHRYDGTRLAPIETHDSRPPLLQGGNVIYDEAAERVMSLTSGWVGLATMVEENLPPEFDGLPQTNEVAVTRALELVVEAHDPEDIHLEVEVLDLPNGATFDGRAIRWVPGYDDVGTYPVTIEATDGVTVVQHVMTLEVYESAYDFLPEGELDFTVETKWIDCRAENTSYPPAQRPGPGSARCHFTGRNPGLVVAWCTGSAPLLTREANGVLHETAIGISGEGLLMEDGGFRVRDKRNWPRRGEIAAGLLMTDEGLQFSATVYYRDWYDQQRSWTVAPGNAAVELE